MIDLRTGAAAGLIAAFFAGCGQAPTKPSEVHLRSEAAARPEGTIPPPVQITPVLPKPQAATRPETYSVVVNRVAAQELLFALARDARLQIDVDPAITGNVTLNAIDQTLPQILARIARQIDMRYELDGQTLVIMRDQPVLRVYRIDYLSAAREVTMRSTASTQFGGSAQGAGGSGSGTGASTAIDLKSQNTLWESLVQNVKDILRESDRIIPVSPPPAQAAAPAAAAPGAAAPAPPPAPAAQPTSTFLEAGSVIGNRETGVLYVRATNKQHERVQEFLDQVMASAKRQVLIEATIAEVQLRNEYQRGIEWSRVRPVNGLRFAQPAIAPATSAIPGFNANPFVIGYTSTSGNFSLTLRLLEQFGDVRVLSSPKLSVLNNQTAILRVTRDIIYFTITPSSTPVSVAAGGAAPLPSFSTTPVVAVEGFMMAVLPQINDSDSVIMNVRPTIRRTVGSVSDPNPALIDPTRPNLIPLFETREFDSMLRMQSGDVAVLAGLIQDQSENTDTGIPGVRSIPLIGEALSNRAQLSRKTELVIFLRATVVRDASVEGDYRELRGLMPGEDFFSKPNPARQARPPGPSDLPQE